MKTTPYFSFFNSGELSPSYYGRGNDPVYAQGAKHLYNVRPLPQGGFRDTGGSWFAASLPSDQGAYRAIPFVVSEDLVFILCLGNSALQAYSVNDDGDLTFHSQLSYGITYNDAQLMEIQFCQNYNTIYLAHQSHPPRMIQFVGTTFSTSELPIVTNEGETVPFQAVGERPGCVAFFNGRLYFAGTVNKPQGVWASRAYYPLEYVWYESLNYTETELTDPATWADPMVVETEEVTKTKDIVRDDNAFEFEIASDRNDTIVSMSVGEELILKTLTSEWVISSEIHANNVGAVQKTRYGSKRAQSIMVGGQIIMLSRDGRKVTAYQGGQGDDLTFYADHILDGESVDGVVQYDYARNPDPQVFFVKEDYTMAVLLYVPERGIAAWYNLCRKDRYLSVAAVTTKKGDYVFTVMSDGTNYWIECLDESLQVHNAELAYFNGFSAPVSARFNAQPNVYCQGIEGERSVMASSITYPTFGFVPVGFGFVSAFQSLGINAQGELGAGLLKTTRIGEVSAYVVEGGHFSVEYGEGEDYKLPGAYATVIRAEPHSVVVCPLRGSNDYAVSLVFKRTEPFPMHITSFMPEVEVNEI